MVVNIKEEPGYDVYIGRAGKGRSGYYGNPIRKGYACIVCQEVHKSGSSTFTCFEKYARDRALADPAYRSNVAQLKGKILGCFCAPYPCHGSVLIKLANEWSE